MNIAHFWTQGDTISHIVLIILLLLSSASWTVVILKGIRLLALRWSAPRQVERFWNAATLTEGMIQLRQIPYFYRLAEAGDQAVRHHQRHVQDMQHPHLAAQLSLSDMVTRSLRQRLNQAASHLESGQTLLASVGSTAPFIGLFGTVWGIYHALLQIGLGGQHSVDKIAGPVGEALMMTAFGLLVAIPAVLAFNAFNRSQRLILTELDAFAYDLHAYFTTGYALHTPTQVYIPPLVNTTASAKAH